MNPLKSLMALGLAFGLSGAAYCAEQNCWDGSGHCETKKSEGANVPNPEAKTVDGDKTGAASGPLNAVAGAIKSKGSAAQDDVAARFADYLASDHYLKDSYLAKAKTENPKFLESLKAAVQSALASDKVKPDNAKMDKNGDLAALYIMIGPGDQQPSWLDAALVKGLASQKARGGTWPTRFEKGMSCWREGGAGGVNCGKNEGPFAGTAGDKGVETDLDSWTLGVAQKALAVADEIVADNALGEKEIRESIENNDEGVIGIGGGKRDKPAFSVGNYGADDLYVDGAVYDCVVVDPKNNHCRKMSMKLAYNRNPMGELSEALTICDVTLPGVPGGTGCETVDLAATKDILLAGGLWNISFGQSYDGGGLTVTLALKSDPSVKMTTTLSELRQKLGQQAQDWSEQGRCRAKIGAQNYVCVPMAHTLMAGNDGDPVEVARGGLLYYPADAQFKLLGRPPKPMFEADNTQSTHNGTVKLTPPATALGCAGFPVKSDGKLGQKGELCNGGADSDDFMYLDQNDEGIFVAKTCAQLKKENKYANISCKFPIPPAPPKKDAPPAKPGSGSGGDTSVSKSSGTPSGGGDTDSGPVSIETCDDKYIAEAYPGYQRLPSGQQGDKLPPSIGRWTIFGTDGSDDKNKANSDRLCVNKTGLVALGGLVPPDGIVEGVKDAEGHDYIGFIVMSAEKWVPYEDRGVKSQISITPLPKQGEEGAQWDSGSGWKTPLQRKVAYFVTPGSLSVESLKALDERTFKAQGQHLLPMIDNLADFKFTQTKALESKNAEVLEVTMPKGADAAKAFAMVKDGFSFGPALNRTHFQSDEDLAQLQRALVAVWPAQKGDSIKVAVTLSWDKECGGARGADNSINALVVGATPALIYNCDTGGKFETGAEHLAYLHSKKTP